MDTVAHKAYVKLVVASICDHTCGGNSCQLQSTPAVNTGMAPPPCLQRGLSSHGETV